MSIPILMPALSPTMEEGKITKWLKKPGDYINPGDALFEIETDKAAMEVEAVDQGFLGNIMAASDNAIKVNSVIGQLFEQAQAGQSKEVEVITSAAIAPIINKSDITIKARDDSQIEITVREALNQALCEEMERDDNVFLIGEEVAQYQGAYKVSQGLYEKFSERRVIDTPITEYGFTGLAVGAAFAGLRPIVEFMTFNFAMQAIDHIVNSAAKTLYMSGGQVKSSIVFRGPNGAAARVAAQHSQCYGAWYSHIPGLKVVMPYDAADAKGLLKAAIRDDNPVIFLENELLYAHKSFVPCDKDFTLPIGKAQLYKEGKDVTLVACGIAMNYAIKAAESLKDMDIDAEILNLRSLRPLDYDTIIKSVQKTGRLVTIEEGFPQSGIGVEIAARIMQQAFDYLDAPVETVAGRDVPMPYAASLEKLALPCTQDVVAAVKRVIYQN